MCLSVLAEETGVVGGNWNCIAHNVDITCNAESKISPSLKRLIGVKKWVDSHVQVGLKVQFFCFHHGRVEDSTSCIDRIYSLGVIKAVLFSEHMAVVASFELEKRWIQRC